MPAPYLGFREAFAGLASLSLVVTVAVDVYAWAEHPHLLRFLDHLIVYNAPVLIAHAYLAWVLSRPQGSGMYVNDDDAAEWIETSQAVVTVIDDAADMSSGDEPGHGPAFNTNGLPMMTDTIDIHGNPYGSSFND